MNQPLRIATSPRGRRIVLAGWAIAQFAAPLAAADPVPTPAYSRMSHAAERGRSKLEPEDPTPVRLNIFNATWPDILEKLAEQSGSTLVMHDPPPGRFSRADLRKYSREDAVAILNRELEPKGFRILENDRFLIVMSERAMRKKYRPAVLPPEDELGRPIPPETEPEPPHRGYRRQFDTILPVGAEAEPVGAEEETPLEEPGQLFPRHPFQVETSSRPAADDSDARTDPVTVSVRIRRGTATAVAKKVHEAFGTRSELADAGPNGLPSFRVSHVDASGNGLPVEQVAFEVEIDTARDELLVTGPRRSATAISEVLRDLDRFAGTPGQTLRIAPASDRELRLAEQLEPVLAQVNQNNNNNNGQPGRPNGQPMPNQGQPMGQGNEGDNERGQTVISGDLPALIGNLRGEVSIEAVPDLGVLIIRGNDQDVQAVRQVIETLESLSAGQQPIIHLLQLEHVDSAALATLLENVYGRLATVRNRGVETPSRVAVIPIVKPNAVLVIAPEGEMETVLDLAAQLDQPVSPETEFQVFRLHSALASQVATTVETFYEERAGLGARATVIPDVRTNSLIIAARARDLEEIGALIRRIDRDESAWVNQMKVFPLKSAAAEELAGVINTAIQSVINPQSAQQQGNLAGGGAAGGQAAQDLVAARSAVLEFIDSSGESPQLLRSGLLADIRVTPDPRTNALLVSAGEQSLPLIEALIKQLDRPAAAESVVKVFSLMNSDATSVVELLDSLFGLEDQGNQNALPGIQLAGTGEGASLIPLKFATDVRTNSVIATGSGDALQVVEAILLRLDESDVRQRETTVIKLKNAPALDVATAIQNFLTSQRELIQINENLVSTIELLEREIIVVPEIVSNSLLISATPRYFEEINRIVAKLDEAPPQVIIQAMLVEVSLDNTDEFGIELGFQDSTLFDRSVGTVNDVLQTIQQTNTSPNGVQTSSTQVLSRSATPGFLFNDTQNQLGNNVGTANSGRVGTQGLSNFSLGRANADLGYGGFVFSASSANVSVLLRALSAKRTVQILSRPQIRTLDNQIAQVQVGQNVPVVNGVTINALQTTPQIMRDNAGLILTVTPRISPDGSVVMEVAAERSEYTGAGVPIFVNAATGDTVEAPIKDITTARATVSVPTGQTIVLGGIITRNDDTIERKVPYVGDIPYLGQLFRYDSTRTVRRELLIFLTPRVIYNDADNELIKQVEADRLHFIEHEAEAIHGPLYSLPPAGGAGPNGGVPPVLTPAGDGLSPTDEVLPGLPADACPPGIYPPGTLFDDEPSFPGGAAPYSDRPYAAPADDPAAGPYAPPGPGASNAYPPVGPPPGRQSVIQPMSGTVATGRLAGRESLAKPVKKKSLFSSLRN